MFRYSHASFVDERHRHRYEVTFPIGKYAKVLCMKKKSAINRALVTTRFLRNCLFLNRSIQTWYHNLKMLVYHLLAEMKLASAWRYVSFKSWQVMYSTKPSIPMGIRWLWAFYCYFEQVIELPSHPYFVGAQFHPEFKSRPGKPSALFLGTISTNHNCSKCSFLSIL